MTTTAGPPRMVPLTIANIPTRIIDKERFVAWCWEQRGDKWTKVPYDPTTGRKAKVNAPTTWHTLTVVLTAMERSPRHYDGIGFVLVAGDGLFGLDLDHVRDPDTTIIEPWALDLVRGLGTYAEASI